MSNTEATETHQVLPTARVQSPYGFGDKVSITGPNGRNYRARVEEVTPTAPGEFCIVASIDAPRRYKSQLIIARVDTDGRNVSGDAPSQRWLLSTQERDVAS